MQHRRWHDFRHTPLEFENLHKLHACHALQNVQHNGFVNKTVAYLLVAMIMRLQGQAI